MNSPRIVSFSLAFVGLLFSLNPPQMAGDDKRVVLIDAGHGGEHVPGKTDGSQRGDGSSWNNAKSARRGILEKDLTLEYALEIEKAFTKSVRAQELGIQVRQTRTKDEHLSGISRAARAVQASADVFISIHFNASSTHTAEGTKAYICSETHPAWEYLHFSNPYAKEDREFAERLVREVAEALSHFGGDPSKAKVFGDRKGDGGDLKDGLRVLGFARQDTHLYQSVMTLLEVEFIDNPKVESWLLHDDTRELARKAVAYAVVKAVCDHFENFTPPSSPRKAPDR